jgi:hypothetical protein
VKNKQKYKRGSMVVVEGCPRYSYIALLINSWQSGLDNLYFSNFFMKSNGLPSGIQKGSNL